MKIRDGPRLFLNHAEFIQKHLIFDLPSTARREWKQKERKERREARDPFEFCPTSVIVRALFCARDISIRALWE